jgi:UDP-N-acetylmuramate--alanine ligase
MTGTVLAALGLSAATLAGSAIASFGGRSTCFSGGGTTASGTHGNDTTGSGTGAPRFFVAETCEYRRHFLDFHPKAIVLTSVESDHQDFFPTYADIRSAFVDYCASLPQGGTLIYCADHPGAVETVALVTKQRGDLRLLPYGETAAGVLRVTFGAAKDGEQHFSLGPTPPTLPHGGFVLQVPGKHNVLNAAAAVGVALELLRQEGRDPPTAGDWEAIATGLRAFTGAKRRCEVVGEVGATLILDDYAHHPTAIAATLAGLRAFYPRRRIILDFMSHTYSRTAALLADFGAAFAAADEVILHRIYPSARETPAEAAPGGIPLDEALYREAAAHHPAVHYIAHHESPEALALAQRLTAGPGDTLFVTMGAGDNWKLGQRLLKESLCKA